MEYQLQKAVNLKNRQKTKALKAGPNTSLQGNTFDARHLDSFIMSEWGERSNFQANRYENLPPRVVTDRISNRTPLPGQRATSSMPFVQTNIRPSYTFISIGREFPTQQTYVDMSNKPSTLLHRPQLRNTKIKEKQLMFDTERKNLQTNYNTERLFFNDPKTEQLKSPKERREQLQKMKDSLSEFHKFKDNFMFLNKRDRQIKNGWRAGIVGIEQKGDDKFSTFYKQTAKIDRKMQKASNQIQERRLQTLRHFRDTSPDIGFFNKNICGAESVKEIMLPPQKTLNKDWKIKKRIHVDHQTDVATKQSVFAHSAKRSIHREEHLKTQDTRGRGFNLLSGRIH